MKFNHLRKPIDMNILEMARPRKAAQTSDVETGDPVNTSPEEIPRFEAQNAKLKQTLKLFKSITNNMLNKRDFKQFAGFLISGEPGTGKTQRINLLSKVLGIELVTIEAPHIVEEHIVNIPFIDFNPSTDKETVGNTTLTGNRYEVVLADSNLYSILTKVVKISDEQHLAKVYKSSKDVIAVFEAMGGSPTEIPDSIKQLRAQYTVILFLDEFFRQQSPRIKNMLRGILNGKVGNHDIPKSAYVIYASNLHDEGLGEIQQNFQFQQRNLESPSKDEWFSWLVNKFEDDKHVKLNPKIVDMFHHVLSDDEISNNDEVIRTSPRRWEQLLLYINSSLPVKDEKEAASLLSNVKLNFKNYLTGEHSKLTEKVLEATVRLIKDTSNIEVSSGSANEPHEWRETLKHQIQQKMKIGEHRKYVPIISGLPGIGKTAQAAKVAHDLDLRFIDIDISNISAEDVVGIPLPGERDDKEDTKGKKWFEVHFSLPALYQLLTNKIKEEDKAYLEKLKAEDPKDFAEKKKEYEARPYKYLIFFDELNRNSPKVFNGIRRVLLEKNFGPAGGEGEGKLLTLPSSAIMIGAINPHDAGAEELTKHMQDVLDIVDAKPSWPDTVAYLQSQNIPGAAESTHELSLSIIRLFVTKFETKDLSVPLKYRPFHLDLGQEIYISPREYAQLYLGLSRTVDEELKRIGKLDVQSMTAAELKELEDDLREAMYDSFEENTSFILFKHGQDRLDFYHMLKQWIMTSDEFDVGENFFYKKGINTKEIPFSDILGEYLDGKKTGIHEDENFINFVFNSSDIQQLQEDIAGLITDRLSQNNFKHIDDYVEALHPVVRLGYRGKLYTPEMLEEGKDADGFFHDDSVKASKVENFFREILFAFVLHHVSGDRLVAAAKSLTNSTTPILNKLDKISSEEGMDLSKYSRELSSARVKVSLLSKGSGANLFK